MTIAVLILHDPIGRGVHADELRDLHDQPRLLAHLALTGFGDALARFHSTAWQAPFAVVAASGEQDLLPRLILKYHRSRSNHERGTAADAIAFENLHVRGVFL